MTTKRRKFVAIVLLAVIGGVITYRLLKQSNEPEYQGRRLSDWLEQCDETYFEKDSTRQVEAQVALRSIGSNAVPFLVKWISYELPAWRSSLGRISKRETVHRWLEGEAGRRVSQSGLGFSILGTNAVSAVPGLEALMKDPKKSEISSRAIYALSSIGESAIPVLGAGLADSQQSSRAQIVYSLQLIAESHPGGTNACFQILLEALKHNDIEVRSAATNVVRALAPEALTNAPAN